ncbi:MAG TPA: hypothetical protein VFT51_08190 [Bacillales bacterium]|nr:hypothetical protein [Bacillales bacterium]
MRITILMTLIFLLIAGCGNTSTQSRSGTTLKEIQKNYPKVAKKLEALPEKKYNQLKIPSKIPFKVKNTAVSTGVKPMYNPVTFTFVGENAALMVMNNFAKDRTQRDYSVELTEGRKAFYSKNDRFIEMGWNVPNQNRHFIIQIHQDDDEYTKKDLIQIANAIIQK